MHKSAMRMAFLLFLAGSAFSQTEVFEQDVSGIRSFGGIKWNSKAKIQPLVGLEYTIESRTTLGIQGGMPLVDSLFSTPGTDTVIESKFHSYFINPYFMFEFLEPDNLRKLSFSVRGDYVFESTPSDSNLNGFSRSSFGLGPVLAVRLHAGEKAEIIPQAAYQLIYSTWQRNWVTRDTVLADDDDFLQHDISVGATGLYRLTERHGLTVEPKVVLKLGAGRLDSDLLNIEFRIGYFRLF